MVSRSKTKDAQLQGSVRTILGFDRVIHEKSCLAVLYIVYRLDCVEYLVLRTATDMSKGNLSNHLISSKVRAWS